MDLSVPELSSTPQTGNNQVTFVLTTGVRVSIVHTVHFNRIQSVWVLAVCEFKRGVRTFCSCKVQMKLPTWSNSEGDGCEMNITQWWKRYSVQQYSYSTKKYSITITSCIQSSSEEKNTKYYQLNIFKISSKIWKCSLFTFYNVW